MKITDKPNWQLYLDEASGLALDFGGLRQPLDLAAYAEKCEHALAAMQSLEAGAIANPDEGRMVGHYWLRRPEIAPTLQIAAEITETQQKISDFVQKIHTGAIVGCTGHPFTQVLVIGIGGSSLGPVFVSEALKSQQDKMRLYFIDNTDPDGMDSVFAAIGGHDALAQTLVIVISKSGGTIETQNALVETQAMFASEGLDFYANAVRITQRGSGFDTAPDAEKWLAAFPMWNWVGGRTSVLSAVGLLPLALQGVDTGALLAGAAVCDELGRAEPAVNPSLLLALFWLSETRGEGGSLMAVLPYKDRLMLLAKYLQQLVMESLGKEFDLAGREVRQGLAVLGNKGSSDQHSYVQQLVAGPRNAFVVFIEALSDREGASPVVREASTSGDYLQAFLLGTNQALYDHGQSSVIITVPEVSAYYVGMLIALFERAVGFYADFVGVNAYHQPAVEFGKKAAGDIISLKNQAYQYLAARPGEAYDAAALAGLLGASERQLWHILRHLAANHAEISEQHGEFLYVSE